MAGGTDGAFERVRPLFDVLGAHVTHVGAVGAGQVGVKLPATQLGRDLYDQLIEQGDGNLDHSALIRVLR